MDIWNILGIEETADKTEIKRAYAKKAKLYHPEEHPEEYQKLRSAYRTAVKQAEKSKKVTETTADVPIGESHGQPETVVENSGQPETVAKNGRQPETVVENSGQPEAVAKNGRQPEAVAENGRQPEAVVKNGRQTETVPDMQAEVNRTQMREGETEEPSDGKNLYNYEDVTAYVSKENEGQFFLEFDLLMENPCLTNQINCFRALFLREEYRPLFFDAEVRQKLGKRILTCKNFGLHMLDFFETYLADDDPENILKQKEWRRLRKTVKAAAQKDISMIAAPEELDEHQWILYRLRSAGYAGLTTQKAAELYLEQYLPWAKEHREEVAVSRKKKRMQYLVWNIGVVAGVFGAVFLFWFLVS